MGKHKRRDDGNLPSFANKSTQELSGGILQAGEVLALNYIDRSKFTPLSLKEHFPSMNLADENKESDKKEQKKKRRRLLKVKSIKPQVKKMMNYQILAMPKVLPMIAPQAKKQAMMNQTGFGLLEEWLLAVLLVSPSMVD